MQSTRNHDGNRPRPVPEWAWEVDRAGADLRERRAAVLEHRGREREREMGRGRGRWHQARADGLRRGWTRGVRTCGTTVVAGCGCPATVVVGRCGVGWACEACSRRRYAAARERAERAARAIHDAAMRAWRASWRGRGRPRPGTRPALRMVTLTMRHSGDIAADVRRIARAFHRWSSWMRATVGHAPPYMRVREVTPGRARDGHVHYHVIVALPYVSWARARASWARAVGQDDAHVDFGRTSTVAQASAYVAKYVAKGSLHDGWPVHLAASVVDATYGTRTWTVARAVGAALKVSRETYWCRECGAACDRVRGEPTVESYLAALARRAALSQCDLTSQ